jgi:hypothetical protein
MSPVHRVTHVPVHSLPLAPFAFVAAFQDIRGGAAGRNRPAEEGGGRPERLQPGRNRLPPGKETIFSPFLRYNEFGTRSAQLHRRWCILCGTIGCYPWENGDSHGEGRATQETFLQLRSRRW